MFAARRDVRRGVRFARPPADRQSAAALPDRERPGRGPPRGVFPPAQPARTSSRCHDPKASSAYRATDAPSIAPTATSVAREGSYWSRWNRATSSAVMPESEALEPMERWPYGCVPYNADVNTASALTPGTSFNCRMRLMRSVRTRSKSAAPSRGRTTMSDRIRRPCGTKRSSSESDSTTESGPVSVSSSAPIRASASCISMADRVAGPFVEHVRGHRREPRRIPRVAGAAGGQQQREADHRQARTFHGGEREPVRQAVPAGHRKRERRVRPGERQPGAVDRAHAITTGSESGAARPDWPTGTTLSVTQAAASRQAAAAARMLSAPASRYRSTSREKPPGSPRKTL